jgi:Holliday junction resolvase
MPSKSKSKGNGAERELCKYLGEVFDGSFTRVPNSGSFVGGKNAFRSGFLSTTQSKIYKGDIIAPDHMPKLVLESKFYKDFRFHQFLQPGPVPQLEEWIKQCLDAGEDGDLWLICFKINLRGWFVVVPEEQANDFVFTNYSVYVGGQYGKYRITDLKEFCSNNKDAVLRLSA